MQNASADGGKYRDAMIARKAVAVSGGRTQAVTGTGGRASMTEYDGCPGCAVAGRPKMFVPEALDTCQALCDVMSQKTRDAEICDNTRYVSGHLLCIYKCIPTWSSELFAFNIASNISRSPSPLAL